MPSIAEIFEELKRYAQFDEDDAARLRRFRALAEPSFVGIAQAFYDRTREFEGAFAVLKDEDQIGRLQRSLTQWLGRIFSGPYDAAYAEETAQIGRAHVRVGLPQRYMFGGMAFLRVELERIADACLGAEAMATRESLARILYIELAIMLETYASSTMAQAQQQDRLEKQALLGALARTEHRYVNAVEFAPLLIVGLDAHGRILLFNREAERITGLLRDEVNGRAFVELLVAEDLRATQAPVLEAALAGQRSEPELRQRLGQHTLESVLLDRAGKRRHVRWQLAYVPSATQDEIVLFALGEDTTEQLAAAERARQQEKLAATGTLAAGLAHEIRNPLNGAHLHLAFLERALRRSGGDPDALEAVRVVNDEIRRLSTLVSEFLEFARPNPLTRWPVALQAVCERALQLASADAARAGVALVRDYAPKEVVVLADGARIEQVLLNLVRNAIEALASGGRGTVVARVRLKPGQGVVEIEDDGPGIPSGEAPIFDAFFSTKPGGTGLGLAIVHRIVTDHGGDVEVVSKPRRTVFRVRLPIETPGAAET